MTFRSASSGRYRFAVRIVGIALLVIAGMWGSGADAASASADTGIRGYRIAMAVASVVISIGALLVALLHIRRRRLEASVRALQERESALIDASMDAIIGIDRAQRIVLFSAAAERLFQLPAASARGEPLERLLPARFRDAYQRNLRDFIEGGLSGGSIGQSRELKVLKADGAELAVEAAIARICAGGETLFTITLRDVSEKMQLEQALREPNACRSASVSRKWSSWIGTSPTTDLRGAIPRKGFAARSRRRASTRPGCSRFIPRISSISWPCAPQASIRCSR